MSTGERQGRACENPLIQWMLDGHFSFSWTPLYRDRLAYLRLLRSAVRILRGEEAPELEDPFGGRILHRRTPASLTVWSVGKDGVDDGGTGTLRSVSGQDFVLTIEDRH